MPFSQTLRYRRNINDMPAVNFIGCLDFGNFLFSDKLLVFYNREIQLHNLSSFSKIESYGAVHTKGNERNKF